MSLENPKQKVREFKKIANQTKRLMQFRKQLAKKRWKAIIIIESEFEKGLPNEGRFRQGIEFLRICVSKDHTWIDRN